MQKLSLTLLTLVSVFIFSCGPKGKDVDPPVVTDPEPTDTTDISKTVLSKEISTSGSDVTTNTYLYDAQNRIAWFSNTSTRADFFEDTSKIVRDANGLIKQVVYRSDTSRRFPDPRVDSVVFNVFNSGGKYTYKLLKHKQYNDFFKDSIVYTYDVQDRIAKEESYYFDYKRTAVYIKWAQTSFTYDANNDITKRSTIYYNIDGNNNDYTFDISYTYHDKGVNLLNLGNEGIVLGVQQNFSSHTPATMVGTYPQSPQYNRNFTYTYTFNTKYRPLRVTIADKVTGTSSTTVYSYQ